MVKQLKKVGREEIGRQCVAAHPRFIREFMKQTIFSIKKEADSFIDTRSGV
jgi:hypothetical protein